MQQTNKNPSYLNSISNIIGNYLDGILILLPRRFTFHEIQVNHYSPTKEQRTLEELMIKLSATDAKTGNGLKERLELIKEIAKINQNPTPVTYLEKKAIETRWVRNITQHPVMEGILRQIYRFMELAEDVAQEVIAKETRSKDSK